MFSCLLTCMSFYLFFRELVTPMYTHSLRKCKSVKLLLYIYTHHELTSWCNDKEQLIFPVGNLREREREMLVVMPHSIDGNGWHLWEIEYKGLVFSQELG